MILFITLTARTLNRNIRIIARGEQPSTEKKLRQAGDSLIIMGRSGQTPTFLREKTNDTELV